MAEIIDINVSEVVENVQITTTENITTVNINKVTGSGASWGEIEGTLSNQTDLQNALNLKANENELGAVAFSNNYNDLDNKPTIPNITNLVPYTGASQDVDLGNNNLNAKGLKVNGASGSGHLGLKHQSPTATAGGQETALFAGSDGELYYKNDGNTLAQIASRTWVSANFASKFFSHKLTTPTAYVTGTVSETEVYRLPLPPGSFNPVDVLKIPLMLVKKLGTNGTVIVRGKMSTSPTMPTGTTDLIFQTPVAVAGSQTLGIIKTFFIDNGNIKGTQFNGTSYTDNGAGAGAISEKPFDIAVTNYLYLSVINGSASDQTRLDAFQLINS